MLERELGRGGMATVYLEQDVKHERPVALKVLLPELATSLGPDRFQREIKLAARLQHPHILAVYDSGETAGLLWFTMPFVRGESLRDRLRREHRLPVDEALRITCEAALALDYAHQEGVVHRDIKPENLLLTKDGNTLVADFGIAREDGQRHVFRGLALAYLGRKAEAIAEGERGVALWPISRDAYQGAYIQHQLVRIYLLVGEPEKALDQLEPLLKIPYYLSPGWLRIDPTFAPLKGNPHFERLAAGK